MYLLGIEQFLSLFEDLIWDYLGAPVIVICGLYLSWRLNFFQVRKINLIFKNFYQMAVSKNPDKKSIHPLKVFFASIGGCIGLGNIASICLAVKIGGPGALFWIWVTGLLGMVVKYGEIFLGMKYRERGIDGVYQGGPLFYLKRAFNSRFIPFLAGIFLCVYGIEVYMFKVVVNNFQENLSVPISVGYPAFLALVLYSGLGGIRRVSNISSMIIPLFLIIFTGMCGWVLIQNISMIGPLFKTVFVSAFTGHGAMGGFAGASMMTALSQGVRRGCYTGDVGIGYASIIHTESANENAAKQAALSIIGIFIDTFIVCTGSILIILVTGVWSTDVSSDLMVQKALEIYFPGMRYFMPFFIFLLGLSTIISFFAVGLKTAKQLFPKNGKIVYTVLAAFSYSYFVFLESESALALMSIFGGLLLLINTIGIIKMAKEIRVLQ